MQTKSAEISLSDKQISEMPETKVSTKINNRALDKVGVWVSAMCAVHCLFLPLLLPALPILASSFVAQHWFEHSILSISIIIGFASLFIGFKQYHRQLYPMYSLSLGALVYWNKDIFGVAYEPYTIAIGAGLIIGAHLVNLRLCRQCKAC